MLDATTHPTGGCGCLYWAGDRGPPAPSSRSPRSLPERGVLHLHGDSVSGNDCSADQWATDSACSSCCCALRTTSISPQPIHLAAACNKKTPDLIPAARGLPVPHRLGNSPRQGSARDADRRSTHEATDACSSMPWVAQRSPGQVDSDSFVKNVLPAYGDSRRAETEGQAVGSTCPSRKKAPGTSTGNERRCFVHAAPLPLLASVSNQYLQALVASSPESRRAHIVLLQITKYSAPDQGMQIRRRIT